jgi:hypothetical protein
MTCRKSFELDLAAFLARPGDAEWDEFRAHYPRCVDCAAEVAAWTALGARLGPEHPAPETLLRFADDPGSMAAEERDHAARHVARCPTCADELRALGGFAANATEDRRGFRRPARAPVGEIRRRSRLRTVGRALWNPALPYAALLALVLLPRLWPTIRERAPTRAPVESYRIQSETAALRERAPEGAPEQRAGRAPGEAPLDRLAPESPAQRRRAAPELRDENAAVNPRADAANAPEPLRLRPENADGAMARQRATAPASQAPELAAPPSEPLAKAKLAAPGSPSRDEAELAEVTPQPPAPARPAAPQAAAGLAAEGSAGSLDLRWTAATRELVVVLPERARRAGIVNVSIRDATGGRELKERIALAPSQSELRLDLPASWSTSARVVVELQAEGVGLIANGTVATR